MIFDGFTVGAIPVLTDAQCDCGVELVEVDNGFLSSAMFCRECESVYTIKLVKADQPISKEFLDQCREQAKRKKPIK